MRTDDHEDRSWRAQALHGRVIPRCDEPDSADCAMSSNLGGPSRFCRMCRIGYHSGSKIRLSIGKCSQMCSQHSKLLILKEWRRDRDSNPGYLAVYTLSKRAPSATRPSLQRYVNFLSVPELPPRLESGFHLHFSIARTHHAAKMKAFTGCTSILYIRHALKNRRPTAPSRLATRSSPGDRHVCNYSP